MVTLPETNELPMKTPLFPCKYHQKGGFSTAMLVLGRVSDPFKWLSGDLQQGMKRSRLESPGG